MKNSPSVYKSWRRLAGLCSAAETNGIKYAVKTIKRYILCREGKRNTQSDAMALVSTTLF